MNAAAGPYAGMDRFAARARIIEDLRAQGFLERVTDHTHAVGTCDRCGIVVEPRLSLQWFVKMEPLAQPAIAAVERGDIEIIPENWRAVYFEWMRNIRDWCISRQLWWGHRIPAWHCDNCKQITVARTAPVPVRALRIGATGAGNRRARNLVQLGLVAFFHAGLARQLPPISAPTIPRPC